MRSIGRQKARKVKTTLVVISVGIAALASGVMGCSVNAPSAVDRFTEFYMLGDEDKATEYPTELRIKENGEIIVGIINREHETVTYRVVITIDGIKNNQTGLIKLEHNKKWEGLVAFTPDRAGDGKKVEFLLYKEGEGEPYLKLHLWVDVIGG